ncbi:MAG: SRPBCC family protein [Halomonas sp.]|nr:SRPBCC family protein [Halomonas sp.]MCC5884372.1 SRPBCC family protein [Halomonas sp.]
MARFEFATTWHLEAPIEAVFAALTDSLQWPEWWPGLVDVQQLAVGDGAGIGRTQRFVWKSRLGYCLCFDIRIIRVREPFLIEGVANGDVAGTGCWQLREESGRTLVRYLWRVRTVRPWMGLLARVARPLVIWNHNAMMRAGRRGLARHLDERAAGRCV